MEPKSHQPMRIQQNWLQPIRNEQNCPKKVMAFVLFLCLKNTFRSLFLFIFMVFEKVNSSSPNFYELWNTIHSRKNWQFFRHEKKFLPLLGFEPTTLQVKIFFWFSYCVKITQNVSLCILYTSMSNCSQKWTKKGERQQNNVGGALSLGFLLTSETLFSRETTFEHSGTQSFRKVLHSVAAE